MNGINDNSFDGFKYSRYKYTSDVTFPSLYANNMQKAIKKEAAKKENDNMHLQLELMI